MSTLDAIVIGAGIVGTACACRLAEDGRRVLVLDPLQPGSLATAAGMGHIVLIDDSPAHLALTRYGRDLWAALGPCLPDEAAYRRPGTLWIAQSPAEVDLVHRKAAALRSQHIACQVLDGPALARAEPRLRHGLPAGLLVTDDAIVFAPAAARWLLNEAAGHSCSFRAARVARLIDGGVELDGGERLHAPVRVVAAGTAAPDLLPSLPIRPRKGHLILTAPTDGFCRAEIIELAYLTSAHGSAAESIAFNVQPRAEGRVLIGASRQFGVTDDAVEPRIIAALMARAAHLMPGVEHLAVERTWTGFRAATPDAQPLIGLHPDTPGLMVAAGHEGLGITTALATGQIIADLAAGRTAAIPIDAFRPDRPARWSHA